MTSSEFIIWLKGFVSAAHEYAPTPKQWDALKNELSKVSDYEDQEQLENDFFGAWDDKRIDIIGQNGNEGLHYDKEGVDELLKRYNEPETQKRLNILRDAELGIKGGYRATEEDEDEFDDYGKRIPPCVGHEIANQEEQNI